MGGSVGVDAVVMYLEEMEGVDAVVMYLEGMEGVEISAGGFSCSRWANL
jgi:hypothetical protein